ncbi:polyserase-2-like [Topomyia yanbarensis]|uniref:polyserase-2-like n=1 Tax=Topomyia yanbarensis TaxID=2498891 RepID=UPI00273B1FA4|nr:polyserase-2-like [Topomyia yanbarensis]XP_058829028.1 polyserase-2-like [Topomyia yanbarensis]
MHPSSQSRGSFRIKTMIAPVVLAIISAIPLLLAHSNNALYQCGIRKRFGVQLVHHGWIAELGQWPWHVGLFHRNSAGSGYRCGGTLVDERHVLTSAHCVVRSNGYPMKPVELSVHIGLHDLRELPEHVQVMNVSVVHVHPEFELNRNDIALLVLSSEVKYSDYVIPICLDAGAGDDVRTLEGNRGWVTGWGQLENGTLPRLLRTAQMPVVSHLQCVEADPVLFGRFLNQGVFCAGDRNGTSVCKGDSGGGMYFSEGDRFVLKGIVSFSGMDENSRCDTSKFIVFANVGYYLPWIKNLTRTDGEIVKPVEKRISESECDRYKSIAKKRGNGICYNSRSPHSVTIIYEGSLTACSGILVSEDYVLFPCHCRSASFKPEKVRIGFAEYLIQNVTCHPKYKNRMAYNDLALIKLADTIRFSPAILPACLANNWTENLYETLLVTGHVGAYDRQEPIESIENRVVAKGNCNQMERFWKVSDGVSDGEICVLNTDPERTESVRLPGAALQTMSTRTCMFNLLGVQIATSTEILTRTEPLDLYARVSHHLDWLEKVIWGEKTPDAGEKDLTEIPAVTMAPLEDPVSTTVGSISTFTTESKASTERLFTNREFVFPDHPFLNLNTT